VERFVAGDLLVVSFPFSNLIGVKRRPVLVLKCPKGDDLIVLQITGSSYEKSVEVLIKEKDFLKGSLKRDSFVRIDKIASIEKSLIKYKIGSLNKNSFSNILNEVCSFLKS